MDNKVFHNMIYIVSSSLLGIIVSVFSANLLGRYLTIEDFGKYSFSLAFAGIIGSFSGLGGMKNLMIREIARDNSQANNYFAASLLLRLISFVPLFIIAMSIVWIRHYNFDIQFAIIITILITFIGVISRSFTVILRAYEKFKFEAYINIFGKLIGVFILAVLLIKGLGVYGAVLSLFVVSIINILSIGYFAKKHTQVDIFKFYKYINKSFTVSFLKNIVPFMIWSILGIIYFKIDIIMIEYIKGMTEVGIYNAAFRIYDMLLFLPAAISGALFPQLSKSYMSSTVKLKKLYSKGLKLSFLIGLPSCAGLILIADKLIPLIWTEKYIASIPSFRILSIFYFFCFLLSINSTSLTSMNRQKFVSYNALIGVIINIGLNLFLIPKHGAEGASIATVMTEGILCMLSFLMIQREFSMGIAIGMPAKIIFATAIMCILVRLLNDINLVFLISIGVLSYLLNILLFNILSDEEKKLVFSIWSGKYGRG